MDNAVIGSMSPMVCGGLPATDSEAVVGGDKEYDLES